MKKTCTMPVISALILITNITVAYANTSDSITSSEQHDSSTVILTLQDAIKIAMSENITVKIADKEIERCKYAKKGTYAALFPKIDANAVYNRTIKKQVMYIDFGKMPKMKDGIEVGRYNTYNAGISASMPLVNMQLWKSLEISGGDVEMAVEKARSSKIEMIAMVKQSYYSVLLAKEVFNVYKNEYANAVSNAEKTQMLYKAGKASDLDMSRAETNKANIVPNLYNAENAITLALWQLKAVMGIDLEKNIDITGRLKDYAEHMFYDTHKYDSVSVANNSSIRQLALQSEQLAKTIKMQTYAYIPTLAANFSYSINAMSNDFKFNEYRWTPHSYVGVSLSIPLFSAGKRYYNIAVAKVQNVELNLKRTDTERQLKIAVKQYLNNMETAMKSYISSEKAVELAEKAYNISEKAYSIGKNTITDLNDSRFMLTKAKLSESQAIFNFISAKNNLEKTIGSL